MARLPDLEAFAARARPEDRRDRRPDPLPQPHRAAGRAHRRAPDHDAARRVPAGRLPRQAVRRDAPRAGARADRARHRDAGARARAAVGDGPARRAATRRIRGPCPRRWRRSPRAGRGVIVLLHRPESARRAAPPRDGDAPPRVVEAGSAQLRHRRADPARPQRRPHAAARAAAQDAEHDGLRSRGDRLRRAAGAHAPEPA